MDYYGIILATTPATGEILMAFLADLPFDNFEEKSIGLIAYIPVKDWNKTVETVIQDLQKKYTFTYEKKLIPYRNWNAEWKASFQPIVVNAFCAVRASFHPRNPNVPFDLIIDPKMAFGTGHHETTYSMLEMMKSLNFKSKKVLDYGCGTGILAILASKLEANPISAVDIEIESYENTINNANINSVSNIKAFHGDLSCITSKNYDIILANINRTVLLNSFESLYKMIVKGGVLIISGCLLSDEKLMLEAIQSNGFIHQKTIKKNKWLGMKMTK